MSSVAAARGPLGRAFASQRAPTALFALLAVIAAGLIVTMGSQLTFYLDEWALLINRPGYDAAVFLDPHIGHPVIGLTATYRLLQATIGMDSVVPFYLVSAAAFVLSVALLFIYLRRCVGAWLALAGGASILFLGASHENLLVTFQISFFVPMSCGIAALLLIERDDRDIVVAALLVVGLLFSGVGLAFLPAVALAIVLAERRFATPRLWVVVLPALLFLLWYICHGDASERVTLQNLLTAPGYVLDGFASATSALLGLASPRDDAEISSLDWGRPLLVGLIAIVVVLFARGHRPGRGFWVVLTAALSFWLLVALSANDPFRTAELSRYQYVGAIFILLLAGELFRGARASRDVLLVVAGVVTLAVGSNLSALYDTYETRRADARVVRGGVAGLEIARDRVDPAFRPDEAGTDFVYFDVFTAGAYLTASASYGNLGYEIDELATAPASARRAADQMLIAALELEPGKDSDSFAICRRVTLNTSVETMGGAEIRIGRNASATVSVRRYGDELIPLGKLESPDTALLIPADRSPEPWEVVLSGRGPVGLCTGAS